MIVLNDVLKGKHSVAIGGHIRPDGDCVGSTIGLYLYLTTYYPEIETDLYLEEIPEAFQMMGHRDVPKHEIVEGKVYDLFISLDCGDDAAGERSGGQRQNSCADRTRGAGIVE